jgi:hypothetical protein
VLAVTVPRLSGRVQPDRPIFDNAAELTISAEPTFPGPDRIWLLNGRVLLPKSRFADLKNFVDWLKSK